MSKENDHLQFEAVYMMLKNYVRVNFSNPNIINLDTI